MPRGDGTGPDGLGPMTGRGLGRCFGNRKISKGSIWGTIITAIAGAVIKDLSGPNSKIKKLTGNIFKPKQIKEKDKPKLIQPEFEVLESEGKDE
ncbi:MAG: DUF5320 domain-containing protein [Armatimonadetes bacterium]|nr:DUF5320 domain-containing protein [Armatimonadota bacterium]